MREVDYTGPLARRSPAARRQSQTRQHAIARADAGTQPRPTRLILTRMRNTAKLLFAGAFALLLAARSRVAAARCWRQGPGAPRPSHSPQPPSFRVSADLISTDVIVRDAKNQFVPDLKKSDFELYEDGVKQDDRLVRPRSTAGAPTTSCRCRWRAPQEGLLIPPKRPTSDASGRVFILFIDDLHLDFRSTPKTRELLKKISKNLIHDGDMFGIVTTGTSSVSQQLTYDVRCSSRDHPRITGNALKLSGDQGSWRGAARDRPRCGTARTSPSRRSTTC